MTKPGRKGIARVILSTIGVGLLLDDVSGRLQKVELLMPAPVRPYLPFVYGGLFVVALLLLKSEYKDELEALRQPDLTEVLNTQLRLGNEIVKVDAVGKENKQIVQQMADLRTENDNLTQQVEALTKLRPRLLSHSQHSQIMMYLMEHIRNSQQPEATIYYSPLTHDAELFARQIRLALRDGGVHIPDIKPFERGSMSYSSMMSHPRSGNNRALAIRDANVTISVADDAPEDLVQWRQLLLDALTLVGVSVEAIGGARDSVDIVVGSGSRPFADFQASMEKFWQEQRAREASMEEEMREKLERDAKTRPS